MHWRSSLVGQSNRKERIVTLPQERTAMSVWYVLLSVLMIFVGLAVFYLIHRLGLWLEERGWLHYKNKKPDSSGGGCFIALQQVLEPPIKHVRHVKEENRHQVEKDASGQGDPFPMEPTNERR